jgi:hypothetical protein
MHLPFCLCHLLFTLYALLLRSKLPFPRSKISYQNQLHFLSKGVYIHQFSLMRFIMKAIYFARYGAHSIIRVMTAGRCPALRYGAPDGALHNITSRFYRGVKRISIRSRWACKNFHCPYFFL